MSRSKPTAISTSSSNVTSYSGEKFTHQFISLLHHSLTLFSCPNFPSFTRIRSFKFQTTPSSSLKPVSTFNLVSHSSIPTNSCPAQLTVCVAPIFLLFLLFILLTLCLINLHTFLFHHIRFLNFLHFTVLRVNLHFVFITTFPILHCCLSL